MKLQDTQIAELEERFKQSKETFEKYKIYTELITGIQIDLQTCLSETIKSVTLRTHTKAQHFYRMLQLVIKQEYEASPMQMSLRIKLLPTKYDQFNLHQANDLFVYKVDKVLAVSMSVNAKDLKTSINTFCDSIDQLLVIYCTNKVT